jgi:multicomponent K+:H+ antiporter subunit G
MLDYLLSFLLITGATLTFIGSLGLLRLKDFYTRLHGPTKATTLGVGSLLIASAIYFSTREAGISMHELLITLFLFITAPVSAHMLAKAALHLGLPSLAQIPEENVSSDDHDLTNKEGLVAEKRSNKGSGIEQKPTAALKTERKQQMIKPDINDESSA